MTLKMKLTSAICAFLLILGLTIMGIMAAPSAKINLGGSLTFSATDIYANVTGSISNEANEVSLDPLTFDNETTEADVTEMSESWSNKTIEFKSDGSEIVILITIENLASDRPLYASVNYAEGFSTEVTKTMQTLASATAESGSNYDGSVITIPKDTNADDNFAYIKLTMEVTNKNASLSEDATWGYDINLMNEKPAVQSILDYDSEKNYYYLEMGTYNGNPVRWRYVSDVTNGIDTAVRFAPSSSNAPLTSSGKKGMFILESDIILDVDMLYECRDAAICYYTDNNVNETHKTEGYTDISVTDYAASHLRAFLTGNKTVAGDDVGSLMSHINLDESNEFYTKIQGRSLTDLYSGISGIETASAVALPTQFNGDIQDKFWALSANEAYRILGGNSDRGNELVWDCQTYIDWRVNSLGEPCSSGAYYLRCSFSNTASASMFEDSIDEEGMSVESCRPVRPAFILEF